MKAQEHKDVEGNERQANPLIAPTSFPNNPNDDTEAAQIENFNAAAEMIYKRGYSDGYRQKTNRVSNKSFIESEKGIAWLAIGFGIGFCFCLWLLILNRI